MIKQVVRVFVISVLFLSVSNSIFPLFSKANKVLTVPIVTSDGKGNVTLNVYLTSNNNISSSNANFNVNENFLKNVTKDLGKSKDFFLNNKIKVLGGTAILSVALSYFYVFFRMKSDLAFLRRSDVWSKWKEGLSLSELFEIKSPMLIEQLLIDIQKQYTNVESLDNFSTPLSSFIKSVDDESVKLSRYLWWANKIKIFHLEKVFSLDYKLLFDAQSRIDKLGYLKKKIWEWLSMKKVSENMQVAMVA